MLRYGSLFLVICIFHVNAENVVVNVIERVRRDIPDECRQPPPPDHLTEVCCDIPTITGLEDAIESCHEQIHKHPPQEGAAALINKRNRWSGKFLASAGPPDGAQSPSHKGPSHERRNCFMECIFNTTGYLTPDGNLNEEALSQKIQEEAGKNPKWSSVAPTIHKKCITSAKDTNAQSQGCKPGPAEYIKCIGREAFFNCPADLWNNDPECNVKKTRMEKCPNLPPPPPPRPNNPPPRP